VKTLTLNVKARIARVEKTNDKAPDFRIYAGRTDYAERGRIAREAARFTTSFSRTVLAGGAAQTGQQP
jgi:uncharacterized protein (DUF736 family)